MPTIHLPYRDAGYFSTLICDYLDRKKELAAFYGRYPSPEALAEQAEVKGEQFSQERRTKLVGQLHQQYASIGLSETTRQQIDSLAKPNSFTITTGHQLNLFTGPLYFLYKIVSVINLCRRMKAQFPGNHFVPVFWMASEDHDFDEINFFRLQGKKFKWEHPHGGAVGELDTNGIEQIVPLLRAELGPGAYSEDLVRLFEQAYTDHSNLADATRFLADALFGEEGLVVVDGNDKVLKELFAPYAKQELLERSTFKAVSASSERLEAMGYSRQVNPREINLFYLHEEGRKRIVEEDGNYQVLDTHTKWTQPELIRELEDHPERFSPNALLRPLYQEVVLPNLCYIGGGGEMAYWLQLLDCFKAFKVEFPVLMLRNSVLLATQKQWNKFQRFGLGVETLFQDWHELSTAYVAEHSRIPIDFEPQRKHLKAQFKSLHELADQTDPSFRGAVAAQEKKQLNGLDKLEKRLLKAQKKKMSDGLDRLGELKEALFPQGSLQERGVNFAAFYKDLGPGLIDDLLASLDPFDQRFSILLLD